MIGTTKGRRLDSAAAARRIGKRLHNQEEPSAGDNGEVGSNHEIREPVPVHCRELAAVEKDVGQVGREAEATATVGTVRGCWPVRGSVDSTVAQADGRWPGRAVSLGRIEGPGVRDRHTRLSIPA
jgi:hypothetical protein